MALIVIGDLEMVPLCDSVDTYYYIIDGALLKILYIKGVIRQVLFVYAIFFHKLS